MKLSKQMKVAKHALAIFLKPGDKSSLEQQLEWARNSWPDLSQRVLRSWVKALYVNPERYEFTGMVHKDSHFELKNFFNLDEVDWVESVIRDKSLVCDYDMIVRSICHHAYVYKQNVNDATINGIEAYYGSANRFYPADPKLAPLEKK